MYAFPFPPSVVVFILAAASFPLWTLPTSLPTFQSFPIDLPSWVFSTASVRSSPIRYDMI
ncbi:hypothetical protein CPB84DRAFT_237502 [Gymnopilus junonius]|uniref:Uncharacterized protein n=1 Tax=Gymnopilus junonius TaxID=109634 RepID=A0A9P5NG55_GYMJU|nr:hypothetical protein CPB84DRAFT_237502 [Gymnopilus junonius]